MLHHTWIFIGFFPPPGFLAFIPISSALAFPEDGNSHSPFQQQQTHISPPKKSIHKLCLISPNHLVCANKQTKMWKQILCPPSWESQIGHV